MNLLGNPNKLQEVLEVIIQSLQDAKILPEKLAQEQKDAIMKNLMDMFHEMDEKGITLSDKALTKDKGVFDFLASVITGEFHKTNDFKLLFPEKLLEKLELKNEDKELVNKLQVALDKLKNAKDKDSVESAFKEVMDLCNELQNKLGNDSKLKPQLEYTRMLALEMKNQHHEEEVLEQYHKNEIDNNKKDEPEDPFILYLTAIYGCNPTQAGSVACTTTSLSIGNQFGYGANISQGLESDRSLVGEQNRLDLNRSEPEMLERALGMGKVRDDVLNTLIENRTIVAPPELKRE